LPKIAYLSSRIAARDASPFVKTITHVPEFPAWSFSRATSEIGAGTLGDGSGKAEQQAALYVLQNPFKKRHRSFARVPVLLTEMHGALGPTNRIQS
jgi:hypothetical protein